jgi:hypothetical protein
MTEIHPPSAKPKSALASTPKCAKAAHIWGSRRWGPRKLMEVVGALLPKVIQLNAGVQRHLLQHPIELLPFCSAL